MEITVHPSGFGIRRAQIPQQDGSSADATVVQILDASGIAVTVMFAATDWERFAAFVQDPEGETKRAEARAKLVMPVPTMAPSIKKH